MIPDLFFEPLLTRLRGARVGIIRSSGNVGDDLIHAGTASLLHRHGIDHLFLDYHKIEQMSALPRDIWCWCGGGNISGRYHHDRRFLEMHRRAKKLNAEVFIFPQTIEKNRPHLKLADVCFVREAISLSVAPDSLLLPDLALAHPIMPISISTSCSEEGIFLRTDMEGKAADSQSHGDPAKMVSSVPAYLELASQYKQIITDRLHFAIAALIVGRSVTLVGGNYWKNKSMYATWLHHFDCSYVEEWSR